MEPKGLAFAPEADRRTLIRRLSFDLVGLPPSPEEIEAFVRDRSVDAYERLVDRLLASPHHGERWGRHWLDVARYADSDGYESDRDRPEAYRYRDFVIRALNADMPFDQFVRWQIAGDEDAPGRSRGPGRHRASARPPPSRTRRPPTPRRTRPRSATTSWTTCSRRSARACSA